MLWPLEKLLSAHTYASRSFFDAVPQYKPLERRITKRFTPDLYNALQRGEEMRQTLLELLDVLISSQEKPASDLTGETTE